ncbi:hypothetical protein [Actinophytocola xanthii]|nr:hypothetical protein [Actinophytocola xanthii]
MSRGKWRWTAVITLAALFVSGMVIGFRINEQAPWFGRRVEEDGN